MKLKKISLLMLTVSSLALQSANAQEAVPVVEEFQQENVAAIDMEGTKVIDEKSYRLGSRRLSEVEEQKVQERRASEMPKDLLKKQLALPTSASMLFGSKPTQQEKNSSSQSLAFLYGIDDPYYLARIHPNAYYYPAAFKGNGEKVELNDGSIWYVRPGYRSTVLGWAANDPIFIKPNAAWFSSYAYRYVMQNMTTGEVAEVSLHATPLFSGPYTHWITGIDYQNGIVYLNDGTVWPIGINDLSILNSWFVNDRIIVGVNNKWRFDLYPHILINVQTLNYCEGSFLY